MDVSVRKRGSYRRNSMQNDCIFSLYELLLIVTARTDESVLPAVLMNGGAYTEKKFRKEIIINVI